MPSNDALNESDDRLDRFLIAGPTADAPREIAGIDAFLAEPTLPVEPSSSPSVPPLQTVTVSHDMHMPRDVATIDAHRFPDEAVGEDGSPILESFPPETVGQPVVADAFGDADASLIAPPTFDFTGDAAPESNSTIAPDFAAGVEQGRGDDLVSAMAANPIDDRMLADPSALLSAAPPSNSAVALQLGSDRFDPWSSEAPPIQPPPTPSRFGSSSLGSGPSAMTANESWARADDRSSADPEALDRLESRLSRAVAQLEEAVSTISASGRAPLGSRPRGFRGRIDA